MGSTTIHFPEQILSRIDRAATRRKISRNRYVLEACEAALIEDAGEWPKGYFDIKLSGEDSAMLMEASVEMETEIYRSRHNRGVSLF